MNRTIIIAKDFSPFPGGRYYSDGPNSGQRFRDELLEPAFQDERNEQVTVDLDGTEGFGSSFLEEAFGGLVRQGFTSDEIVRRLQLRSSRKSYVPKILAYIRGGADPEVIKATAIRRSGKAV